LPIARARAPCATDLGLVVLARAPAAPVARCPAVRSVERGGLPAEGGELAGAGDRDHAGGLAPAGEVVVALVQALLGAPGDRDHARVLAVLAAPEGDADRGAVTVVPGGLHEQSAPCPGPALVIAPWRRLLSDVCSEGTIPRNPETYLGLGNRRQSPTSAHRPAAVSVSIPRKQRKLAIVAACEQSGI
jgi:hypothetical protein